jgi:hypothetical protein
MTIIIITFFGVLALAVLVGAALSGNRHDVEATKKLKLK